MRMGLPQVVTSDQGREFVNHLNEEFMATLGIRHQLTTAYHPQVLLNVLFCFRIGYYINYTNVICSRQMALMKDSTKLFKICLGTLGQVSGHLHICIQHSCP